MRVGILTREYPPEVYGGAGVHVDFLVRELRRLVDVDVHCLGAPREGATAHSEDDPRLAGANPALRIFAADLEMAAGVEGCDLVHSHTWYANLAGHLAAAAVRRPARRDVTLARAAAAVEAGAARRRLPALVVGRAHRLRGGRRRDRRQPRLPPRRAGQLPGARRRPTSTSSTTASTPTSTGPVDETDVVERLGVDPARPSVVFVGRITRQKGVPHLLRAALEFDTSAQIVLLAGAADTPELAAETEAAVSRLRDERSGVVWVSEMLPREDVRQVLSHSTVFVCPSIYEPLGIVNLEAMACATAVVASDVGGIPEVVADGETGLLVHYDERQPEEFERALAAAVNELVARSRARRRDGSRPAGSGRSTSSAGTSPPSARSTSTGRWCAAASPPTYVRNPNPYGNSGS